MGVLDMDPPDPPDPPDLDQAWPRFAQGDLADVLPPGPLLTGLTEAAVRDLDHCSDNELMGVVRAARRQIAREQYKMALATAVFGRRRRAAFEDAARRGVPVGCRPGGFPGEELAIELVSTTAEAGHRIDDAIDLTSRLPRTLAGMAAGLIDETRAGWIALYTRSLTETDAARADEILAEAAPDLRAEQLARKAAALEMKLNPEAVAARRQHAKRSQQRVEARRELSGNASLAGRELDTADVLAASAHIDALARQLRDSGLADGTLDQLRAQVFSDLTQGRDPLDRITQAPAPRPPAGPPAGPGYDCETVAPARGPATGSGHDSDAVAPAAGPARDDEPEPSNPAGPSPFPALITLLVPAETLLGSSAAPGQAGGWGLLDRDETRAAVGAASRHPRTRWCVTLTGSDGTAQAHACARGQHPRLLDNLGPQPPPDQLAEIVRRLKLTFTPVAHPRRHGRLRPHPGRAPVRAQPGAAPPGPRPHRHLRRPRLPGTGGQRRPRPHPPLAQRPDRPVQPGPRCRTHHRAKQAPDWMVEQTAPGVTRWTLPSGRVHTATPTRYDGSC